MKSASGKKGARKPAAPAGRSAGRSAGSSDRRSDRRSAGSSDRRSDRRSAGSSAGIPAAPGEGTARRFARTRHDHARETAEDYAELVLELSERGTVRTADLARELGVSHVTVLRTLDRLSRDGVIERDADGAIALTADGRRIGRAARARHLLVVAFLERIGVPHEVADVDAEGIEHHVSATTLARMTEFLHSRPPRP